MPAESQNQLEQLKKYTTVVADTGDFESISAYKPTDATTNPSLILSATSIEKYKKYIKEAIDYSKKLAKSKEEQVEMAMDKLLVIFGKQILSIIPGRVSTEVEAIYSFDKNKTIEKALRIIELYKEENIDKSRVLIKIAATYEGIQAAKELETKHNINCNLTLIFSFVQAVECANCKVTLISPFVGRILDWYKDKYNKEYKGFEDPGVKSVQKIYRYYKKTNSETIVMGASFRNVEEIQSLAGCDYLTISPKLLEELKNNEGRLEQVLSKEQAIKDSEVKEKIEYTEPQFRLEFNSDPMAVEKLAEGIRKFSEDGEKLRALISEMI